MAGTNGKVVGMFRKHIHAVPDPPTENNGQTPCSAGGCKSLEPSAQVVLEGATDSRHAYAQATTPAGVSMSCDYVHSCCQTCVWLHGRAH